ncbi:sensor histidine kinase [Kitasatospora kifunensis]|uniref:histidine kinase n=1 Tax=Kitasatospora kifunensis TaxID=58351 RepID=A0A7W7R949_KITKI|nr:HAMP domain-containing sensor histidine kinase [Kitasatospora kifunensis]MBB4927651.1 two-component system sensor histidine kinase MprB [Kitasatospora kifunensis]
MRAHARWRRRRSLRTRLALACTAAVTLVALGVCAAAFSIVRYELLHQLDLSLTQQATLVQQQYRNQPPQAVSGECGYLSAPACTQIVPADPAKDPSAHYVLPVTETTREVAAGHRAGYYTDITVSGHAARMLTTPMGTAPPGAHQAVQVALRSDAADRGVRQAGELMAAVAAAGVLLAAALGYAVARTGLAPVTRLTTTAERIADTRDAGLRIELPPGRREDELTRLAGSFNTMLGELEQSIAAQRRLIADASHELRTPLTALRTNAELLARADRLSQAQRDRASAALQRQLREVTGLVNDLIELARDEEPQPLLEQVRIGPLVAHCVASAQDHWPAVTFTLLDESGERTLPGVPARLVRLVSNLLDNAAKFSPPGGAVEVTLTAGGQLTVRDHGPGIRPEDLPYVFDRFYRASAARALPGSGLGLAMARQIARAHGAVLTAESAPGGGALFRLVLPGRG